MYSWFIFDVSKTPNWEVFYTFPAIPQIVFWSKNLLVWTDDASKTERSYHICRYLLEYLIYHLRPFGLDPSSHPKDNEINLPNLWQLEGKMLFSLSFNWSIPTQCSDEYKWSISWIWWIWNLGLLFISLNWTESQKQRGREPERESRRERSSQRARDSARE